MRLIRGAVGAIAVGIIAAVVTAMPAQAARQECAGEQRMAWVEPSTVTVEYGAYWNVNARADATYGLIGPWTGSGTVSGVPTDAYYVSQYNDYDTCTGHVGLGVSSSRAFGVGSYELTAKFESGSEAPTIAPAGPARLTITPAQLGIQTRITADPSHPAHAIITAAFTGAYAERFATEWGSTSYPGTPLNPEGTWRIVVTDAGGAPVHEVEIDRVATDDALAASTYWLNPPAGEYEVTASFELRGEGAGNFVAADSAPFAYTAVGPPPEAQPTASPAPTEEPSAAGPESTLPLWVPVVAGVLSLALAAILVVQIVRARRPARPATGTDTPEVTA